MEVAGIAGKGMLAAGLVISVANIASAQEGQMGLAASQEAGAWVGALAFGAAGAKAGAALGTLFGPGPGTAVGAALGGIGGGITGALAGERAGGNVYVVTQPGLQAQRNVGPIPEGAYYLNPQEIQELGLVDNLLGSLGGLVGAKVGGWPGGGVAWGDHRVALKPGEGTNTHGRSGFFIHGGAAPGSAGCIDLTSSNSDFFSAVDRTIDKIPVFVDYGERSVGGGGW